MPKNPEKYQVGLKKWYQIGKSEKPFMFPQHYVSTDTGIPYNLLHSGTCAWTAEYYYRYLHVAIMQKEDNRGA